MICLLEMEMMRRKAFDQLHDVVREHEKSKAQLEAQKQQLMLKEQELRRREELNESEKRKLDCQKEMVRREDILRSAFFSGGASQKGK